MTRLFLQLFLQRTKCKIWIGLGTLGCVNIARNINRTLGPFLISPGDFSVPKSCFMFAVFAIPDQGFSNFENDTISLCTDGQGRLFTG